MGVLEPSLCAALAVFRPPPRLSVSQWADRYRQLSREASSEPGQWRTARAEYQRDILDAISDPLTHTVVVMSCAQVGKSEMLLNGIGFHIAQDAAPILFLQPTVEIARLSEARILDYGVEGILPPPEQVPAVGAKVSTVGTTQ